MLNRIKDCLRNIHYKSLMVNGIVGESRNSIYESEGFITMSEVALSSFSNAFHP